MRLAICNEMFEGWEFERVCATAAEIGYEGVEIAPFTLGALANQVSKEQRDEMREAARRHGVEIVGLHWVLAKTEGFYINHPDASVRDLTVAYLHDLISLCADLGGAVIVFGSPKQRSVHEALSREQAWDYARETFGKIVPALEARGVTFCLEPLGPEETDFINTGAEAAQMVREIDSPRFGLLLDVKAMCTEPTPIPDIIRANAAVLKHFHANDANRRGPGFGDTDFRPIAQALKQAQYDGWVSVEVFDFSPDPITIARNSMEYLHEVFSLGGRDG